jgi:hypothetical protein
MPNACFLDSFLVKDLLQAWPLSCMEIKSRIFTINATQLLHVSIHVSVSYAWKDLFGAVP